MQTDAVPCNEMSYGGDRLSLIPLLSLLTSSASSASLSTASLTLLPAFFL